MFVKKCIHYAHINNACIHRPPQRISLVPHSKTNRRAFCYRLKISFRPPIGATSEGALI